MKVIILTDSKYTKQHYKDLQVRQISDRFKTAIWDVSGFISHEISNNDHNVKFFTSTEMFDNAIAEEIEKNNIIFVSKTNPSHYKILYPLIKKYNVDFVCIDKDISTTYWDYKSQADFGVKDSFWKTLKAECHLHYLSRYVINRVIHRFPKYDYFLSPKVFFRELVDKHIPTHHIKYDEFLSDSDERIVEYKYALFVDTAAVLHPMFVKSFTDDEIRRYYKNLNCYFKSFEKKNNLPIIVAGYPKIDYEADMFNNRLVIKYKTSQLIKNAEVVITHYTTSIMTALFANKPILFLKSNQLMNNSVSRSLQYQVLEYAKMLKVPCDCIEDSEKVSDYGNHNSAYQKYIDCFLIRQELKQFSNGDIINTFLKDYSKTKFGE